MKDIVSLRNHLFDQLNRLAEASAKDLETETTRAASIVQVSESIIKSAEVENQFIAITKSHGSGFVPVVTNGKAKSLISHIEDAANNKYEFNPETEINLLVDNKKKN